MFPPLPAAGRRAAVARGGHSQSRVGVVCTYIHMYSGYPAGCHGSVRWGGLGRETISPPPASACLPMRVHWARRLSPLVAVRPAHHRGVIHPGRVWEEDHRSSAAACPVCDHGRGGRGGGGGGVHTRKPPSDDGWRGGAWMKGECTVERVAAVGPTTRAHRRYRAAGITAGSVCRQPSADVDRKSVV